MSSYAYYNEYDKNAAAWLRELIKEGLIANGEVDERSIVDVTANDLRGFSQHHFFAGIGGWSYALRLAGWNDNKPVWTASLPCQPFSAAGKKLGKSDERHLLPHFIELVKQCRPPVMFGEQVPGAIKHGWLDVLYAEMEACGYACGSIIAGAHSVGAAHIRQRLYWVGVSNGARLQQRIKTSKESRYWSATESTSDDDFRVSNSSSQRLQEQPSNGRISQETNGNVARENPSGSRGMGNSARNNEPRLRESEESNGQQKPLGRSNFPGMQWIHCQDNKYRPVKPGIFPLANGIPKGMVYSCDPSAPHNENATQEARAMRLKGYGNAIVPLVAAEFIGAYMSIMGD